MHSTSHNHMDLMSKKCVPCEGNIAPLTAEQAGEYLPQVKGWELTEHAAKIRKEFVRKDFNEAMAFVNAVAAVAESEDHHPDIHIFYKRVILELWTHAIGGLSENDFIVAAKINALA